MQSRDPSTNVVLLEDAAAVLGVIMAAGCMGLTSLTGKSSGSFSRPHLDCSQNGETESLILRWLMEIRNTKETSVTLRLLYLLLAPSTVVISDLTQEAWQSPIKTCLCVCSQVTRTTTVWVPLALERCWAPCQPSSSIPTQRPCWVAPYRPTVCRSWQSSWRMTQLWGQQSRNTHPHTPPQLAFTKSWLYFVAVSRAIHDVKATDMGLSKVRFKAEVDFDGRVVTRSYLEKQDIDQILNVCCFSDDPLSLLLQNEPELVLWFISVRNHAFLSFFRRSSR